MSVERVALRQQRDLGQIVETAFSLYFQNFWRFFSIAALLIPFGILTSVLAFELIPTVDDVLFETPIADQEAYDEAVEDAVRDGLIFAAVLVPLAMLQLFAQWFASLAIVASLAHLDAELAPQLSHAMRQRGPAFPRAYGVVFSRFWTLAGAFLRKWVVILPLTITFIGIPAAIFFWIRWRFTYQAVILDGTSARAALSYSADAVRGRWWRTFGIAFVIWIIVTVAPQIMTRLFAFAPVLISGTASAVMTAAILPLGVIAMTLLYVDLNARRGTDVPA